MAIAVSALAIVSCSKADLVELQEPEDGYRYSFSVVDDFASTKAILGTTGVVWENNDRVGMFLTGYTGYANIDIDKTPKEVVLYSKNEIQANTYAYSYYPYASDNTTAANTKITLSKVQAGGASAMPMTGIPFLITTAVPVESGSATTNGSIRFLNLGAIIEFNPYSTNSAIRSETIQSISFKTSDGAVISGDGYLNLTQVDPNTASSLVLDFSDDNNAFDVIKVNQTAPIASSKGEATHIYMAIRPGTYSGTITVNTNAHSYTKTISNKEFQRNHIKPFNMDLAGFTQGPVVVDVKSLPYTESFASNIGDFTSDGLQVASTEVWQHDAAGYMKATAYVSGEKYAAESWLTSPWISLEGIQHAAVSFDHVHRYAGNATNELTLWVITNESGASWTQLTIPIYSSGSNWTFVNSDEISLDAYVGKQVKLAYKYTSNTSNAATWEIKNFSVYQTTPATQYTLLFNSTTMQKSINDYTSSWTTISDGLTWTLTNFNNNRKEWSFVKCGRKNKASTGTIVSPKVTEAISKVKLTIDAITAANVTSIKLYVAKDTGFTQNLQTIEGSKTTGVQTFTIPTPTANCYYKLEFVCTSGTSNGLVTVSKVVLSE